MAARRGGRRTAQQDGADLVISPDPSNDAQPGLNPDLKRSVDKDYSEAMHGSEPLATVSVKKNAVAIWPFIWLAVTIVAVLLTIWLVI